MGMTLNTQVEKAFRLKDPQRKALLRMKIHTLRDLLFHFPARYGAETTSKKISELEEGENVTIVAKVKRAKARKSWKTKVTMADMTVEDTTGTLQVTLFNQPYVAKQYPEGSTIKLTGKVSVHNDKLVLNNPKVGSSVDLTPGPLFGSSKGEIMPVYPESRGITSLWFTFAIAKTLRSDILGDIEDPLPEGMRKKYNLPTLSSALVWIHLPQSEADAIAARKRFSFEEIFFIQLERKRARGEYKNHQAFSVDVTKKDLGSFIERFPFTMTDAQNKAIGTILTDLKKSEPMTRLLEGDVGSGKTAVAATTAFGIITTRPKKESGERQDFGNLQVAYMAPTEILARQHFESFIEYFEHTGIQIGLITGTECRKFPAKTGKEKHTHISRSQLLKWVANGEIPILIGTHSLIQKSVAFKHLAYVIIDEQHRFGVQQRAKLSRKDDERIPHLLSMTATPIPRTLALTIYGDLDLTLLDEMPAGRKTVKTEIVKPDEREKTNDAIRKELEAGRQVYVICPRIDEPDPTKQMALQAKSAVAEARRLQDEIFTKYRIGLVHSKLKPKDKEAVMQSFTEGDIDILVATSVVEVGVNVPNATVIVIEGAERFGLAQLHQLRGRVLRSSKQAYCYLYTDSKSAKSLERLKALETAKNGFELSELDLKLRGAGALSGTKQWGITDLGMEAIQNIKMVEAARTEAEALLKTDPDLADHPEIASILATKSNPVHFE